LANLRFVIENNSESYNPPRLIRIATTMTKHRPITISLDSQIVSLIDHQRGDVSRSRFVERLIESGLEKVAEVGA
jgi:hypothetical protein